MSNLKIKHQERLNLNSGDMQFKFDANYDQGSEAAEVQFSLMCKNVPVGSIVGFSSDKPGPTPPIYLPPTKVISYPSFAVGETSYVPANYTCIITVEGTFSQTPPPDVSIELQAVYVAVA
jgi:hypothetical protein